MNLELNHPFFIYPRGFMSEYNDYNHYRGEVKRLYKFINNLSNELNKLNELNELNEFNEFIQLSEQNVNRNNILIPFIIGSPMEDSITKSNTLKENYFQFRQLFPNYINNFIKSNPDNKFIQIIIISPDDIFSTHTNKKPLFMLYESFDFVLTNLNEYVYTEEKLTIKINIFNCPVPCLEKRTSIINRYDTLINGMEPNLYNINTYRQTQSDIEFINNFYSSLNRLFSLNSNPSINIVINSWASFKNLDGISERYNMFPKILELANEHNIIASEWEFIDELFYTKIVSQYKFDNKNFFGTNIDYVFDDIVDLTDLPTHIVKKNFNYNNLFTIDFNSQYCLKKQIYN